MRANKNKQSEANKQAKNLLCPKCHSTNTVKKGIRKNKFQSFQQYQCKNCRFIFKQNPSKNKTYPINIILKAISTYNLGYTLEKTKDIINNSRNLTLTPPTILTWLDEYKDICTFHRLRPEAIKLYKPNNIIFKKSLQHNQIYKYQLHKAKLELTAKELQSQKFALLKTYLKKILTEKFPHHIFQPKQEELNELTRSSQIKFKTLDFVKLEKQNLANKLASLGLLLAKTNKERHQVIQNFMLVNDSTTIAVEVPVYLTNDDIKYFKNKGFTFNFEKYKTPITGHMDILQIRNKLIHILDYKPDAEKINPIEQLTIYALALASKTKLAIKDFKCAWFDDKNYYEFFPLHVVYKKK